MNEKISKTNANQEFIYARLDEIQMSPHARLRAKASLARAEAVADAVVRIVNLVKHLLKILAVRPVRRPTSLAR